MANSRAYHRHVGNWNHVRSLYKLAPKRKARPCPTDKLVGKLAGFQRPVRVEGIDPETGQQINKICMADGDWISYKGHQCIVRKHRHVLHLITVGEVLLQDVTIT